MAKFIFVIVALSSLLIDCNSLNSTEQTAAQKGAISTTTLNSSITDPITTAKTTPPPPPPPNSTTAAPTSPSPPSPTTTPSPAPSTTPAPNKHDRSFDLPSFIGGVILSLGLAAIGYVVFKFYKTRTDPNYRTI